MGHLHQIHYAGEVLHSTTLSEKYGNLVLVNSCFIKFGIIGGNCGLQQIVNDFHCPLCQNVMDTDELSVPDMQMLALHSAMKLINEKLGGNMWSFAQSFGQVCG